MLRPLALAISVSILSSSSAFAHQPASPEKTMDQMTCAEAQAYGKEHGYVLARGAGNDAPVPIFPVEPDPYQTKCGKGDPLRPWFLPASDTPDCIMNWVCGL